jgi:hypothetical protein
MLMTPTIRGVKRLAVVVGFGVWWCLGLAAVIERYIFGLGV